jgi:PAS domain S-box-containing protein
MEVKNVNNNSSAFRNWLVKPKSIAISILILFILITSIVIFLVYPQYKNTAENMLAADKASATGIAATIAKHNSEVLQVLATYARKQLFIDAAKKRDVTESRGQLALLKKDLDFNLALITDRRGILWANFPAFPVGSNLSYRDWHKGVSADWKPHVSGIFQVMTGDKPIVVAYSVPFFDEKGNPIGILTIYKKLDFITASIKRTSLNRLTVAYVTDQAGNILFGTNSDFQKKITGYSLFAVVQKAMKEDKNQIEIQNPEANAETGYLSMVKVEGSGWLAIVQRDYQKNLQPQQTGKPATIIIFFVLLFVLLSLGLIYFRKIFILKNKNEQLPLEIKIPEVEKIEEKTQKVPESSGNYPSIPLIVWDHDLIIVRFDHVFEEMTGWSKEEVLGKKVDVLFPEKTKKESLARIGTTARSENPAVLDVPILHSDGKTAMVHGQYITPRKQGAQEISRLDGKLERRILERTGNLEGANRRLEAFSYSICHALLTPLQSIEKICDIAKEKNQGKTDDKENNYPELISRETKRMGQLINDMKKLSHLNRSGINRQSIDVSKIVGEIMETYRQKFPDREVAVTIEKDILIDGDELLLKIALENLIDNAWKYTTLKERATIKFGATLKDGTTALFIRDNGAGFDMAHINRLFGAFQHIDTSANFSGTGIGLATVQRIVERHGGEIWAESKPEKGATFYFTLSQ